ncbi:hypothetical protein CTEN210_08649 [Chaetoceros tenuissimus]|uniref:Uncharacterized protein n=1 Tax=Chaetoceros tenuissimus TaxID=426638 RepID=A0AAD3H6V2_9STRA|nr:hypothetical protein CTEN210_08649 [Chaetoceros tenuissimus]
MKKRPRTGKRFAVKGVLMSSDVFILILITIQSLQQMPTRTNGFTFSRFLSGKDHMKLYSNDNDIPLSLLKYRFENDDNSEKNVECNTSQGNSDLADNSKNDEECNINDINDTSSAKEAKCSDEKLDFVGAGTLGDIMSDPSENYENNLNDKLETDDRIANDSQSFSRGDGSPYTPSDYLPTKQRRAKPTKSGLVTSTGGTLSSQFGNKIPAMTPLERIALTANGNLQRIFSSYYDAPVHVHVDHCVRQDANASETGSKAVWNRVVHLSIFDQDFCKATSEITVNSADCIKLVESGEVGIGQLFRFLDKLPTFTILDAGRNQSHGGMWRQYTLHCEEFHCEILEEFAPDAWNLSPLDNSLQ